MRVTAAPVRRTTEPLDVDVGVRVRGVPLGRLAIAVCGEVEVRAVDSERPSVSATTPASFTLADLLLSSSSQYGIANCGSVHCYQCRDAGTSAFTMLLYSPGKDTSSRLARVQQSIMKCCFWCTASARRDQMTHTSAVFAGMAELSQ